MQMVDYKKEGKVHSEYLIAKPFMSDELVFIVSPQSNILRRDEITSSDLAELSFFIREIGSGTRELFENIMQQQDINIRIAGVYNNAETIKKAVVAGLGASVISRLAVRNELAGGSLASFGVKNITFKRYFSIVYHKNKFISQSLQSMIDLCYNFEDIISCSLK